MQTTKNRWLGFLRIGVFISPLLVSSLWTVEPQSEEKVARACSVHQVALKQLLVPVIYGLPDMPDKVYLEANRKLFPNSRNDVGGGCVINWSSLKFQQVDYCPQCRKAEKEWISKYVRFN